MMPHLQVDDLHPDLKDLIGDQGDPSPAEPAPEPEEHAEEAPISAAEEKARKTGWVPEDEYEGEPDTWRDIREYNTFGDLRQETRKAQAEARQAREAAEQSLIRNNQFRENQNKMLKGQIEALKKQRDDAIDSADRDEANRIDGEIRSAEGAIDDAQPVAPPPVDASAAVSVLEEFNADNPWLNENTPKAVYAKAEFSRHIDEQRGNFTDPEQLVRSAINMMNSSLKREYPDENPNRKKGAKFAAGKTTANKGPSSLQMSDLSREEMGMWQSMGSFYKDEAEFLNAVIDSRKGVA